MTFSMQHEEYMTAGHEMDGSNGGQADFIVRVRGLPWSTKESDVHEFFNEIHDIKAIHFTYTRDGRSTGEAYLELGSEQDLENALLKHREHLKNRYIEVFRATRPEMEFVCRKTAKTENSTTSSKTNVVRIRGLPFGSTKEDIFAFFTGLEIAPDGIVRVTDRSGRLTGEAYVKFVDKETTEQALDRHMQEIGHRYIEVFRSTDEEMNRAKYKGVAGTMTEDGSIVLPDGTKRLPSLLDDIQPLTIGHYKKMMARGAALNDYDYEYDEDPYAGRDRSPVGRSKSKKGGIGSATGHVVHMRGIPFKTTATDIVDFFKPLKVLNVMVLFDEATGRSLGEADVEFLTHEDASEAMSKDKHHLGERYVDLFLDSVPAVKPASAAAAAATTTTTASPSVQPVMGGDGGMIQYPADYYGGFDYGAASAAAAGYVMPPPHMY